MLLSAMILAAALAAEPQTPEPPPLPPPFAFTGLGAQTTTITYDDKGKKHEITIRSGEPGKPAELSVDGKKVDNPRFQIESQNVIVRSGPRAVPGRFEFREREGGPESAERHEGEERRVEIYRFDGRGPGGPGGPGERHCTETETTVTCTFTKPGAPVAPPAPHDAPKANQ